MRWILARQSTGRCFLPFILYNPHRCHLIERMKMARCLAGRRQFRVVLQTVMSGKDLLDGPRVKVLDGDSTLNHDIVMVVSPGQCMVSRDLGTRCWGMICGVGTFGKAGAYRPVSSSSSFRWSSLPSAFGTTLGDCGVEFAGGGTLCVLHTLSL